MAVGPTLGATLACLQATAQLTALLGTVLVVCIDNAVCSAPGSSEGGSRPAVAARPQAQQDATSNSRADIGGEATGLAALEPSSTRSGERQRKRSNKRARQLKSADEQATLSKKRRRSKDEKGLEGKKAGEKKRRAAGAAGAAASEPHAAESPASDAPCADEELIPRKRRKQRNRRQQQQQQQQQQVSRSDTPPALRGQLPDDGPTASGRHAGSHAGAEGAPRGAGPDVPAAAADADAARRPIYSYWSAEDVARLVACVEDAEYRRLHLGSAELDWKRVAEHLGRSAQSVYCKYRHQRITVAQPKATRVRRAISYTWMAIYGTASLPGCAGTGDDICAAVEAHPPFQPFLDRSFRRDSSGVPNWQQRIKEELSHKPYFNNTGTKRDSQAVWRLDVELFNDSAPKRLQKSLAELNLPGAPFLGKHGRSNA